jgi:hypothetical protein
MDFTKRICADTHHFSRVHTRLQPPSTSTTLTPHRAMSCWTRASRRRISLFTPTLPDSTSCTASAADDAQDLHMKEATVMWSFPLRHDDFPSEFA